MVQHMVKGIQFRCLLKVWQNRAVLGLANLQGPVPGNMHMAVFIQSLHLRNCRDCSMFTPQANMKMTLTEITTGNSGNGNSDILKVLITRRRLSFQSLYAYQCFFWCRRRCFLHVSDKNKEALKGFII